MKHNQNRQNLFLGGFALLLTACGGGSGGTSAAPPPPPPPPPPAASSISEFSVTANKGPHRIIMTGGHADDTLTGTCRPNIAGRGVTWSSDYSGISFSDVNTETVTITATGSAAGSGDILCTLDDATTVTDKVPIFVNSSSETLYMRNPLRFDNNGDPRIDSSFILKTDTPASSDINECFGTDLADLEAIIAWRSGGGGIANYCASVHNYTSGGLDIDVLKMYHLPGAFIVAINPYASAQFGDVVLQNGQTTTLPEKQAYSDNHIFLGGPLSNGNGMSVDQFGTSVNDLTSSFTVSGFNKTATDATGSYSNCLGVKAHRGGLEMAFAEWEQVWCETMSDKWRIVSWEQTQ